MKLNPLSGARSYVESEDIFPTRLGKESIPRLLSHIDVYSGLVALCKIEWALEDKGQIDLQTQLDLAAHLLAPTALSRALLLIRNEPHRILFFRPQVHLAMKLLCIYGQTHEPPAGVGRAELQTIGTALFAATDMIAAESVRVQQSLRDQDPHQRIAHQLTLGEHMLKPPNSLLDFLRAKAMYVRIHNSLDPCPFPALQDLETLFGKAVGVPLSTHLEIGLGLLLNLQKFRRTPHLLPPKKNFILFQPQSWFSPSQVNPSFVSASLRTIAQTPEALAETTRAQSPRELSHDFLAMKLSPMIELADDTYAPVSYDFVSERLSSGTFWTIFDYLRDVLPSDQHLRWSEYHGLLFELYVREIAQELIAQHPNEYTLVADATYQLGKRRKKTSDAILLGADHVLVIEATAARLTARRTYALGLQEAFREDCDKVIFNKARELAAFLDDLLGDRVSVGETQLSIKDRIVFPVLVAIEGFPKMPPIDDYIYDEIGAKGTFDDLPVQPLSILSIEDLELISREPPASLFELFRAWHSHPHFRYISLSAFFADSTIPRSAAATAWYDSAVTRTLNEATHTIFGKSLAEIIEAERGASAGDLAG